jgi:CheY-like chemotaxis protein
MAILVTDVGLPGMSGYELSAEARRRRPGLKVLFLSGYDRERASGAASAQAPGTRFLGKPFSEEDLFGALRQLVS